MKKSYLSTTLKAPDLELHWLFRVLFIVSFSTIILDIQAQCPIVTARASLTTICSGTIASIELSANQIGTTYTWTITQEEIVGAAQGGGDRIAQTLITTGNAAGSAVYTITPIAKGCKGNPTSVKILVNPIPVITATPLSSTIASGSNSFLALTSDVAETAFSWSVVESGVAGATRGAGSEITQVLTTNADIGIATYRIRPSSKGCAGEAITARVTVKR